MERQGVIRADVLTRLVDVHVGADELIVELHRKLGGLLVKARAIDFACQHIGEGEIRMADGAYQGFVVVTIDGVATGWSASITPSPEIAIKPGIST